MPSTSRHIVFVTYEGVSLLDLSGPLEAFRVAAAFARPQNRRAMYECTVVSTRGGGVKTADGVELSTKSVRSLARKPIDTLIVPGAFAVDDVTRDRTLVQWVKKNAPGCRRVCSVCIGSFLLAAAGILNAHRAATHWMHAPLLARRYPSVTVEPDAIFVHDGMVWTSAGVTSGIDLALALIEQDAGRKAAIEVARILVVYLKRAGGQSQVEALAEKVHMSPRNVARVYTQMRGSTPAKAVEAIRIDAARRRLEETRDRVATIAENCGFSDEEQMRSAFIRNLRIPPREYRKRFASTES